MKLVFLNRMHLVLVNLCVITSFVCAQTGQSTTLPKARVDSKIKIDSVVFKPTKEVDITMEIPAIKGSIIHIVNSSRNLDIKTWPEAKVKVLSTTTIEEGAKVAPGIEMFERAGVTLRSTSSRVELNSRASSTTTISGSTVVRDGHVYYTDVHGLTQGKAASGSTHVTSYKPKKRVLTVYVPEGSKLDIDNKSSDIILRSNFKEAKFDITSTNLDCQNVNDLELAAKYSIVNVGDVDDATIEFENGTLRANNVKNLDIDSKSSSIEYENGSKVYMRSQRDNITIESIKTVEGRKLYGELRIDKLLNTFDLEGTNADVRIRNIMPEVEKIKLNDKYADIRLPIKNLQSYTVAFEGNHSTVFAPFEKIEIKEEPKVVNVSSEEKVSTGGGTSTGTATTTTTTAGGSAKTTTVPVVINNGQTMYGSASPAQRAPSKFTASVGDAKVKRTKFELVCHSCTIDFK